MPTRDAEEPRMCLPTPRRIPPPGFRLQRPPPHQCSISYTRQSSPQASPCANIPCRGRTVGRGCCSHRQSAALWTAGKLESGEAGGEAEV